MDFMSQEVTRLDGQRIKESWIDGEWLDRNIQAKLKLCIATQGQIALPCVPAMVETSGPLLDWILEALHSSVPAADRAGLHEKLQHLLAEGLAHAPYCRVLMDYEQKSYPAPSFSATFSLVNDPPPLYALVSLPCVPAMVEEALAIVQNLLGALKNPLPPSQVEQLGASMLPTVQERFAQSADSTVFVRYHTCQLPDRGFTVNLSGDNNSIAESYQQWIEVREPPLFGKYPDAKVLDVVATLGNPADAPVLDVGAGTGRNSFPVAQLGHPVVAIDVVPEFVQQVGEIAVAHGLPITSRQMDILDPLERLPSAYYQLAIAAEVVASHFRSVDQLRLFLVKLCDGVKPGGLILFSTFLAVEGYEPDDRAIQLSQVRWSYIMTRRELQEAMAGLPIELISDESVYDYEHTHLPPEAWPPTGWFARWSKGLNLFPFQNPTDMELRWLLGRRTASPAPPASPPSPPLPRTQPSDPLTNLVQVLSGCLRLSARSVLPCFPAMVTEGPAIVQTLFQVLGGQVEAGGLTQLQAKIASLVQDPTALTPYSRLMMDYAPSEPPASGHTVTVTRQEEPLGAAGKLFLPCVPSLLDFNVTVVDRLFEALGNKFSEPELERFRQGMAAMAQQVFPRSATSQMVLEYRPAEPPAQGLACSVSLNPISMADRYQSWLETRTGDVFGSHADAKVLALVPHLPPPDQTPVLDVGAGMGRNSLALAEVGFPVDALEIMPEFIEHIRQRAETAGLSIPTQCGDLFSPETQLRPAHYGLAIASEVLIHFRSADQVRLMLAKLCDAVRIGGLILLSTFLTIPEDFEPDQRIQELAQMTWSFLLTRRQFEAAIADLPLKILSDESAHDYEKAHLPMDAWPPTYWFADWARGYNVFPLQSDDRRVMELRWILLERTGKA